MVCYFSCSLAGVFLFSMVYMTLMIDKKYITSDLMNKLTEEQKEIYRNIIKERRNIYFLGFLGGLIISLFSLYIIRNNYKMSSISSGCFLIALTYIIVYIYYTLSPKSDLLVVHLDDEDARRKWMEIYNYMKYNYHISILLGVIFVGLLGYGLCQ